MSLLSRPSYSPAAAEDPPAALTRKHCPPEALRATLWTGGQASALQQAPVTWRAETAQPARRARSVSDAANGILIPGARAMSEANGAGGGNRTLLTSLEGWSITTMLRPLGKGAGRKYTGNRTRFNLGVSLLLACLGGCVADLLGQVRRHRLISLESHLERAASLRDGAELRGIREDFSHGHFRADDL